MNKFLGILLVIITLKSQDFAGNFMNIEQGAKTSASGNAFFSNQGDMAAFRYFPADYSYGTSKKVYSVYSSRYAGLYNQFHIGYTQPLLGGYNITGNWNYSGVSDIPRFNLLKIDDSTGLPTQNSPNGFFSNNNNQLSLTFGKVYDNLVDFGWDYFIIPIRFPTSVTVNYASTSIDKYSAYAFSLDVSTGLTFNMGELLVQNEGVGDLTFFLTFLNIAGTDLIWDKVSSIDNRSSSLENNESLSGNTIMGLNMTFPNEEALIDLGFAYQYQTLYSHSSVGMFLIYDKMLEFRFGLSNSLFTTGFGVKAYQAEIFLSFQPSHELGSTFMMDLSYEIN